MAQKSNWFFLGSLQHVLCMGLMINYNFQDMGISQHLEDEVQHNVRAWNKGKPEYTCAAARGRSEQQLQH